MTAARGRVEISLSTGAREEIVDITGQVAEALRSLGLIEGAVLLFCPHTTAALTVNETADPDVRADVQAALGKLVPDLAYRHAEGNSRAHIASSLLGPSVVLPVQAGGVILGRWQGVYFCEFDGPRQRQVWAFPLSQQPV